MHAPVAQHAVVAWCSALLEAAGARALAVLVGEVRHVQARPEDDGRREAEENVGAFVERGFGEEPSGCECERASGASAAGVARREAGR